VTELPELPELYWSPTWGLIYRSDTGLGEGPLVVSEYRSGHYLAAIGGEGGGPPADAMRLVVPPFVDLLPQCPETRMSTQWGRVRCSYPADHVARMCEFIHPAKRGGRLAWRTGSPEPDDATRCHRFVPGDHGMVEVCGCPVNAKTDTCAGGHHPTAADYRELGAGLNTSSTSDLLPPIPGNVKLVRDEVAFANYLDTWHLVGPATALPVGDIVEVTRFTDGSEEMVLVGGYVAERTVHHKNGGPTRYVIATIDRGNTDA
jgi:hypothetical protein